LPISSFLSALRSDRPKRRTVALRASVSLGDARNATVGSECRLDFFPVDSSVRWRFGIISGYCWRIPPGPPGAPDSTSPRDPVRPDSDRTSFDANSPAVSLVAGKPRVVTVFSRGYEVGMLGKMRGLKNRPFSVLIYNNDDMTIRLFVWLCRPRKPGPSCRRAAWASISATRGLARNVWTSISSVNSRRSVE
jgi:hypothetical protein